MGEKIADGNGPQIILPDESLPRTDAKVSITRGLQNVAISSGETPS